MAKFKLAIEVDENDADYLTKISDISEDELAQLEPVFEAIRNFQPYKGKSKSYGLEWEHSHNWPSGGEYSPRVDLGEKYPRDIYPQLTDDQIEMFEERCPFGENGFHSVESITVFEVIAERKVFNG